MEKKTYLISVTATKREEIEVLAEDQFEAQHLALKMLQEEKTKIKVTGPYDNVDIIYVREKK